MDGVAEADVPPEWEQRIENLMQRYGTTRQQVVAALVSRGGHAGMASRDLDNANVPRASPVAVGEDVEHLDGRIGTIVEICMHAEYVVKWNTGGQTTLEKGKRWKNDGGLLTLHLTDPADDGSQPIALTTMGGEEVANISGDPAQAVSVFLVDVEAALGPGRRRFMLPNGCVLPEATLAEQRTKPLGVWLAAAAAPAAPAIPAAAAPAPVVAEPQLAENGNDWGSPTPSGPAQRPAVGPGSRYEEALRMQKERQQARDAAAAERAAAERAAREQAKIALAAERAAAVAAAPPGPFTVTVRLQPGQPPFFLEVEAAVLAIECAEDATFQDFYASLCERIGYPAHIPPPYWPPKVRTDNQPDLSPKVIQSGLEDKTTRMKAFHGTEFELKIRALCRMCHGMGSVGNFACKCCGRNGLPTGVYGISPAGMKPPGYGCSPG